MIDCAQTGVIKLEFYEGVEQFIGVACQTQTFVDKGKFIIYLTLENTNQIGEW